MKQKMIYIGLASLALGLVFDILFYDKPLGISVFLYASAILGTTFGLAHYFKRPINQSVIAVSVVILLLSLMVSVRDNGLLIFFNVVLITYLLLLVARLLFKPQISIINYDDKQLIGQILLPLAFVGEFFAVLRRCWNTQNSSNTSKHSVSPIVRGVLISLPFLFLFLLLFSSADLVFKRYVGSLFDFTVSPDLISHVLVIGFVGSLFCGALTYIFTKSAAAESAQKPKNRPAILGLTETSILLGSVAFLFLIFVLIQITYLFGGQTHLAATGLTYAEYARKGFFELIVVAVITLSLLITTSKSTVRYKLQHKVIFMWLSGLLVTEVLVILLSAHKRLALYEQTYGFTLSRLFSHLFIGWLAIIFMLLIVHIMSQQRASFFALEVFVTIIGFVFVLNIINPDALIASKNINRFNKTGKIDASYLRSLSADATPTIIKLLSHPDQKLQKTIAHNLYREYAADQDAPTSWQSFNFARSRSRQLLDNNAQIIKDNKDYTPTTSRD